MSGKARHNHDTCVDDALARAEAVCAARNQRLTPLRRDVLKRVWNDHKPIGAYDIIQAMGSETRRIAPPTVYRALGFLMEQHLVHRIASLNAYIGCPEPSHAHNIGFLICEQCQSVQEITEAALNDTIAQCATTQGFVVTSQNVEITGRCANC